MKHLIAFIFVLATTFGAFAQNGDVSNPPLLRTKTISLTRDLSLASSAVAYTGVGFTPRACFALGQVATSITQYTTVFGMVDASLAGNNMGLSGGVLSSNTNFLLFTDATGVNVYVGNVNSFDADGFTIGWTKVGGSPTGTTTVRVMCIR